MRRRLNQLPVVVFFSGCGLGELPPDSGASNHAGDAAIPPDVTSLHNALVSFAYLAAPPEGRFARILVFPQSLQEPCGLFSGTRDSVGTFTYMSITLSVPNASAFSIVPDALGQAAGDDVTVASAALIGVQDGVQSSRVVARDGALLVHSIPETEREWADGVETQVEFDLEFPESPWATIVCETSGAIGESETSSKCRCEREGQQQECDSNGRESCCETLETDGRTYRLQHEPLRAAQCRDACVALAGGAAAHCIALP